MEAVSANVLLLRPSPSTKLCKCQTINIRVRIFSRLRAFRRALLSGRCVLVVVVVDCVVFLHGVVAVVVVVGVVIVVVRCLYCYGAFCR